MDPTKAVKELAARGWSDEAIAGMLRTKTSYATIARIRKGKHELNGWQLGQELIQLVEGPRVKRNGK